jgi:hypothetical protein
VFEEEVDCQDYIDNELGGIFACFAAEGQGPLCWCDAEGAENIVGACSECMEECGIDADDGGDGQDSLCDLYGPYSEDSLCLVQDIDWDEDGVIDNPSCVGGDYDDYCIPQYQNENGDWEGGCSTHHCSNDECNYNCLGMNDCDDSLSNCNYIHH